MSMLSSYLRLLAFVYLFGALVHLAAVLDLGWLLGQPEPEFAALPRAWQIGHLVYGPLDLVAAVGLWRGAWWGIAAFLIAASSQLTLYLAFRPVFGEHPGLLIFHLISIALFLAVLVRDRRAR